MQYYKAKVRLDGNPLNEVRKVLSAPEVLVLQYIHGVDAVIDVEVAKTEQTDLRQEKERLKALYDKALVKREQSIDTIFGPLGAVPKELPSDLLERYDIVDEDDVVAVAKHVTNKEKAQDKTGRAPQTQLQADRVDTVVPAEEVDLNELAG